MTTLIAPDGSRHFVHEGNRDYIAHLLASGFRHKDAPVESPQDAQEAQSVEFDGPVVSNVPDLSSMTVAAIKAWLDGGPGWEAASIAFEEELEGKHRKGALDAIQDYLGGD